jgi:NAD-dependent deacetylase
VAHPDSLQPLRTIADGVGRVVFLTGAGISAESGIPTFRGPEGHWTVGSQVYRPQELATWDMFSRKPELVWPWYLWRRDVCRRALPNEAHHHLVALDSMLADRFTLVTQNVDGLHLRAGSSPERTFEIHGNIDHYRCAKGCSPRRMVPNLEGVGEHSGFLPEWGEALECSRCRCWMRPHVLWFDECYDESNYRFESAVASMADAEALIVVGTTGTTSLPAHMLQIAVMRGMFIVDINPEDNPFAQAAVGGPGTWLQQSATEGLMRVRCALEGAVRASPQRSR